MMITLNLKNNYKIVKEGDRVLEITDAKFTPSGAPTKLALTMKDVEDGASLQNSYNLGNETSVWAMGMMLSTALGLQDGDAFDTKDVAKLIGVKLLCEVTHSEYNDKTYANVRKVIEKVEDATTTTHTEETVTYPNTDILYGRNAIATDDEDELA